MEKKVFRIMTWVLVLMVLLVGVAFTEDVIERTYISASGISKLEAEDWIPGKQDETFHENSYETADVYHLPSAQRPSDAENVSGYVPQTNITADGGYFLTYATDPEWLKYAVEVEKAGLYAVGAYCARGFDGGSLQLTVESTGETVFIPYTAREDNDWSFGMTKGEFLLLLPEGEQIIKLNISWPWDIDYFMFVPMLDAIMENINDPEPNLDPEYVSMITGDTSRIEAENWINGGAGVAFFDDDYTDIDTYQHPRAPRPNNPKQLVPQTRLLDDNNYAVTHMQDPDWMKYKIYISESGLYAIAALVGSNWSPGEIRLYLDDSAEPFAILLASTLKDFDWSLQMTGKAIADLPMGEHVLKVSVYGPFDIDYIEFNKITE